MKATKKTKKRKAPSRQAEPRFELDTTPFEIHQGKVSMYLFFWWSLVVAGFGALMVMVVGAIFGLFYAFGIGIWLAPKQSEALEYWIDETGLHVNQGVFFIKMKTIPYDRITDIVLNQGPLLRACGIWQINIETAAVWPCWDVQNNISNNTGNQNHHRTPQHCKYAGKRIYLRQTTIGFAFRRKPL